MGLFDWFTKKPAPAHAETKPAAAAVTATPAVDEQLAGTWTLDPAHSSLGFSAKHAMVTNVRGTFDEFEGTGVIDTANPSASSVTVVIQAASVNTGVADRDGHLRSGDFFDVETYPELRFASTAVELVDAETWRITGDLTIKDVTRPITVDFAFSGVAQDPFGNVRAGFEGTTTVNRKDWGLVWNAALETGGVLVSEKVKLVFDLSVIKSA